MIQFLKELYFTGFVLVFRFRPKQRIVTRAVRAVTSLALIQCFFMTGIAYWVDILNGRGFLRDHFDSASFQLMVLGLCFGVYLANYYILTFRGRGVKFAEEFGGLKKRRRAFLIGGFFGVLLFTIVFFIGSRVAYRHFFHIES